MTLSKKVKILALQSDMDYVSIAPSDRLNGAPEGWKPSDILGNCKSVISVAISIGEGVGRTNKLAYSGLRHAIYIYMMFGYANLTERLNEAEFRIARLLVHSTIPGIT